MKLRSRLLGEVVVSIGIGFVLLGMGPLVGPRVKAQGTPNGRVPTIEEYQPKSTLVVPEHKIQRAKYPFIDIHSHHWNPTPEHIDQLVKEMDTINLRCW